MAARSTSGASAKFVLENLAVDTWQRLGDSWKLALPIGEETLTDNLLLGIRRARHPNLRVLKVLKPQEALDGIDFELYVRRRGDSGFRRIAVQAKKLSSEGRYPELRRKASCGSCFQIDLIGGYCGRTGAEGAYCFYNTLGRAVLRSEWHCSATRIPVDALLGCSLAPLDTVRCLHSAGQAKTFEHLHAHSETVPLRCLFCDGPGCSTPASAASSARFQNPFDTFDGDVIVELPFDFYPSDLPLLPRFIVVLDEGQ